jgi:hypothetical protein
MDLATGSAGVLLALGAVLHDEKVQLPFLPPLGSEGLKALDHGVLTTGGR